MLELDKKVQNVEKFTFRVVKLKPAGYRIFVAGLHDGFTVVALG